MARQRAARKDSRSKGGKQQDAGSGASGKGSGGGADTYEQELADLLQERIKPGLNRGAIPLLARSIAKDLARRQRPDDASEETAEGDEPRDEAAEEPDNDPRGEADDDPDADAHDEYDDEPEAQADDEADEEPDDEVDEEPDAEADDEYDEEADDEADEDDEESAEDEALTAFEEEMHELQEELGEDWIVRFSVQGDEAWLTAEKDDGTQHVEGPTADVLRQAVQLLDEGGGEST
jgi:hypothetical protein